MKIFPALKSGISRSLSIWKGALIILFISLILVCLIALPVKGVMRSGFGSSMITERLRSGFDIEAFTDPGTAFKNLIVFLRSGLSIIMLSSFILNAFLTGGLFESLRSSAGKFSSLSFWKASARNFWPFLTILSVISLIILFVGVIIVIIPLSIIVSQEFPSEILLFKVGIIAFSLFFLLLTIMILIADYARAWQVRNDRNRCFSAIGFGFRQTFRTFLSSWPTMMIILIIQLLYWWLVIRLLPGIIPDTGIGVFLFFILSQFMFFVKILLKIFRYGSITFLAEHSLKTNTEFHRGSQSYTETAPLST